MDRKALKTIKIIQTNCYYFIHWFKNIRGCRTVFLRAEKILWKSFTAFRYNCSTVLWIAIFHYIERENWDDFTWWLLIITSIIQWGMEIHKTYPNLGTIWHISESISTLCQIVKWLWKYPTLSHSLGP